MRGVAVDAAGVRVDEVQRRCGAARLAYVTPAHQFPLGPTMQAGRRLELLAWAREGKRPLAGEQK